MFCTRAREVLRSITIDLYRLCRLALSLVDAGPCRRIEYDVRCGVCNELSNAGRVPYIEIHPFRRDYLATIREPLPAQLAANLSGRARNQDPHT